MVDLHSCGWANPTPIRDYADAGMGFCELHHKRKKMSPEAGEQGARRRDMSGGQEKGRSDERR
jgi:hypothetical protein